VIITASRRQSVGFCESSLSCALAFNDTAYLNGQISLQERRSRELHVAGGGAIGAAISLPWFSPEIDEALFARQTGTFNSNSVFRIGEGWKGSATQGKDVFRIAIGNENWTPIPGLPSFPWHLP
jgi:hypothetical protein